MFYYLYVLLFICFLLYLWYIRIILYEKISIIGGRRSGVEHFNKIMIIVPYANFDPNQHRNEQLKQFINHMQKLKNKIPILIIEQINPKIFNKGQLYNTAVDWIINNKSINRIILHDVDMLPNKELYNQYLSKNIQTPISLIPMTEYYNKTYGYNRIPVGGGITMIELSDYIKVNGFPNNFWNWGGEDNAFQKRLKNHKIWYHYNDIGEFKTTDIQRINNNTKLEYIKKHDLYNKDVINLIKNDTNKGLKEIDTKITSVEYINKIIMHIKVEL
jgi:hypothetical protein